MSFSFSQQSTGQYQPLTNPYFQANQPIINSGPVQLVLPYQQPATIQQQQQQQLIINPFNNELQYAPIHQSAAVLAPPSYFGQFNFLPTAQYPYQNFQTSRTIAPINPQLFSSNILLPQAQPSYLFQHQQQQSTAFVNGNMNFIPSDQTTPSLISLHIQQQNQQQQAINKINALLQNSEKSIKEFKPEPLGLEKNLPEKFKQEDNGLQRNPRQQDQANPLLRVTTKQEMTSPENQHIKETSTREIVDWSVLERGIELQENRNSALISAFSNDFKTSNSEEQSPENNVSLDNPDLPSTRTSLTSFMLTEEQKVIISKLTTINIQNSFKNISKGFINHVSQTTSRIYVYSYPDNAAKRNTQEATIKRIDEPTTSERKSFLQRFYKFIKPKRHNHEAIKQITTNPLYSVVLKDFIINSSQEWLKNSNFQEKENIKTMLDYLILCCENNTFLSYLSKRTEKFRILS